MSKFFIVDINELNEEEVASLPFHRKEKASRFAFGKDRNLSLAAGVAFARGLHGYGLNSNEVSFTYGKYGKAYLKGIPNIFFNLSHSGTKAIAVFDESEIGCDIEKIRPYSKAVVERCFSIEEQNYLDGVSNLDEEFTRLWACKESFAKALGLGISLDLHSFSAIPTPNGTKLTQSIDKRNWKIEEIQLDGYKIAICYQDKSLLN